MTWDRYRIDARRLWYGDPGDCGPLVVVDLDTSPPPEYTLALPPVPVIGIGDSAHPLASACDVLVERPVALDALVRQITAQPRAAAVTIELLRILPEMDPGAGLIAESLAYGLLQGSDEHGRWLASRPPAGTASASGHLIAARTRDILRLTLDRAAAGNAIDRYLRDQFDEAFALAALDGTITRIVLDARGRSFCLGADLSEFGTTRDPATAHAIRRRTLPARHIAACADRLEVRVQGACVGAGLEMAAWARQLTATADAWFQLPELAMGILPGAGGCVALTRRIGRQRTALMVLSGKRIPARVALGWGLIDGLVDDAVADDGGAHILG